MLELDKKSIATSKVESSTSSKYGEISVSWYSGKTAKALRHPSLSLYQEKNSTLMIVIYLDSDALWSCGSRSIMISDWWKRWARHSKWLHLTPCDSYGSPSSEYRWRSALIGSPGRRSAQQHPTFGSLTTQSPFWDLMGQNLARNGRSDKNGQNLWSQATKSD